MEQYDQIGARLDRLPLARFHYRIFGIISFSLLLTGFLSYSGNVVLAKLVSNGWSGNDSNLLIVFYVQIMPDDFVMQLHRF